MDQQNANHLPKARILTFSTKKNRLFFFFSFFEIPSALFFKIPKAQPYLTCTPRTKKFFSDQARPRLTAEDRRKKKKHRFELSHLAVRKGLDRLLPEAECLETLNQ